jgi:hypothetical protein
MELYRKFLSTMREAGIPTEGMLMLAHRTPSGHGLRLVLRLREGSTPQEDQRWIAELMDEPYDAACKDLSRLSYAVTLDDLFFVDGKGLFFEEGIIKECRRQECRSVDNSFSGVQELQEYRSSDNSFDYEEQEESASSAPKKSVPHGNKESASSAQSAPKKLEEEDTMQAMGYRSSEVQEFRSSDITESSNSSNKSRVGS